MGKGPGIVGRVLMNAGMVGAGRSGMESSDSGAGEAIPDVG